MVDELNGIFEQVNKQFFPKITYVNGVKRGEQYVLRYVAEGNGFNADVYCGTDGVIHSVVLVTDANQQIGPLPLVSGNRLKVVLENLGMALSKGK